MVLLEVFEHTQPTKTTKGKNTGLKKQTEEKKEGKEYKLAPRESSTN